MIFTGSAIYVTPGSDEEVVERLRDFPGVTYHVKSESGGELVVNLEAEDHSALEQLCVSLREKIPQIVEIVHLAVNFEEEIEKIESGKLTVSKPKFRD